MLEGDLSDPRSRRLPLTGAIGGMIIPAIIYYSLNRSNNIAASGWAIPTATDIAFAIGVIILLGSRVPGPLKVFLTSLAIFDDLGAVLIIAVFYTSQISSEFLFLAGVCVLILKGLNKVNVVEKAPYLCVGAVMWYFTLRSGIHATIAGVIVAMFIPLFKENENIYPLKEIERSLHPWVAYGILPVFAFANAGINVRGMGIDQLVHPVPIGIALGLFFGKQIGVFGLSLLAIKFKIAKLPKEVDFKNLYGASILCGIGFTMSLFIGGLSFGSNMPFDERLGIILGSLFSGIVGYIVLRLVNRGKDYSKK